MISMEQFSHLSHPREDLRENLYGSDSPTNSYMNFGESCAWILAKAAGLDLY